MTSEVPGRKDDNMGTMRLSVFGFLRKSECCAGNAMACSRYKQEAGCTTAVMTNGASNGS